MIRARYEIFEAETRRKTAMGKNLVSPEVRIRGPTYDYTFTNVLVTPHDLRTDTFQPRTTTAIDIIMSMGDQGLITYELEYNGMNPL